MSRLLLGFMVAIAVICLLACGESSPPVDQPLSSETEQQSAPLERQALAEQDEAQQSEPDEQQLSEAETETPSQTQQQQQMTTAAAQPTVEQAQQQTQQADEAEQPEQVEQSEQAEQPDEPAPPATPVLRLWNHDGENPSGKFHNLIAPADYDGESPLHLVVYVPGRLEHGAPLLPVPMRALARLSTDHGVAVLLPQAPELHGSWNAADGCCEHGPRNRDDVTRYHGLVNGARQLLPINRLSIVGENAGGWMAYRLACEGLPGLSAIAVLDASFYGDQARCDGARPLSVFHVHPTSYALWRYLWSGGVRMGWNGGIFAYPGAEELARRWADRAGCDLGAVQLADTLDDRRAETVRLRWTQGCSDGIAVELWGMPTDADAQLPSLLGDENGSVVLAWLNAQARVRDLDEPFQPGAESTSQSIESGVWTQEGTLEFVVLDTSPLSTLVRPFGTSTTEPLRVVIPLPGSHGDVWHDAIKWVEVLGDERFAVLLPGNGYRGKAHQDLSTYADIGRQNLFEQMIELAREHIVIGGIFLSGSSGGSLEVYYSAKRCLPDLTGVITGALSLRAGAVAGGCGEPNPVSVLHRFASEDSWSRDAEGNIRSWAEFAGCDPEPERLPNIDVESGLPGEETEVLRWRSGCVYGIAVELWRVVGTDHTLGNPNLGKQLVEWMLNEARVES